MVMAIDGGTTNTRIRVLKDEKIISKAHVPVGVRNTAIAGCNKELVEGLREGVHMALASAGLTEKDLQLVVASGMLTSNVGIMEIPHISTPAGVKELAANSRLVKIPEVIDVPILFIPGVKNSCPLRQDVDGLEAMDIMRGEETETIGILELKKIRGPITLILPGSHTKVVRVNEHNQITCCLTTMGGEIFGTLATNTILADSIPSSLVSELDREMLLNGAAMSRKVGLTRGCFFTRIMSQFIPFDGDKRANFLLGVVLGQDIIAMKNSKACRLCWGEKIVIGGPSPLRRAIYYLLEEEMGSKADLSVLDDETVEMSTAIGARKIGLEHFNTFC